MAIIIPSSKIFSKKHNKVVKNALKEIELSLNDVDFKRENSKMSENVEGFASSEMSKLPIYQDVSDTHSTYRHISGCEIVAYPKKLHIDISRIKTDNPNYYIEEVSPKLNINYEVSVEKCQAIFYPDKADTNGNNISFFAITNDSIGSSYINQKGFDCDISQIYDTKRTFKDLFLGTLYEYVKLELNIDGNDLEVKASAYATNGERPTETSTPTYTKTFSLGLEIYKWLNSFYFPGSVIKTKSENSIKFDINCMPKMEIYIGCMGYEKSLINGSAISVPLPGLLVKFEAKSVELDFGDTVRTIEIFGKNTKTLTSSDSNGTEVLSLGNNLIRTKNTYNGGDISSVYEQTLEQYKKGKETLTLLCSISDYRDEGNNVIISKDGSNNKMAFDIYDEVVPMTREGIEEIPMSIMQNGNAKTFSVLGTRQIYDGAVWQELTLQETGSIPYYAYDLEYALLDDGTYEVKGIGNCADTKIRIPRLYKGVPVTSIGYNAFKDCTNITDVTLPNSVTRIDGFAFSGCSSLININIPDSIKHISVYAFSNCSSIEKIIISKNIKYIYQGTFFGCSSLKSVNIPNGVKTIEVQAFYNCENLTNISIPKSISHIGDSAFGLCSRLAKIIIPDSVTIIGKNAFNLCSSLETIVLPFVGETASATENTHFGYIFGASSFSENESFVPESLKNVIITNDTGIGRYALYRCRNIENIVLQNDTTYISASAFSNCTNLKSIRIPSSVTSIGDFVFDRCYSLTSIIVDEGNLKYKSIDGNLYTNDGKTILQYCIGKNDSEFIIPDSVTSIGNSAFEDCSSLTSVVIPDSVTSIGNEAFNNCTSLTDVYYNGTQNEWSSINIGAGNDYLTNATIHFIAVNLALNADGVSYSVTGVVNVSTEEKIVIPSSYNGLPVTDISTGAFRGNKYLKNVIISDGIININSAAFYNCTSLTNVVIPNSVISIDSAAFRGCSNVASLTIGKNVTTIGSGAFYDCTSISEIKFNATNMNDIISSSYNVFRNAGKNTNGIKVVIGKNVTKIPECLFAVNSSSYYANIVSVEFEKGSACKSIGYGAFRSCSNFTTITIPNSIISIGVSAFEGCSSLTDVYYRGSESSWNNISIDTYNDELLNATIHYNSTI